MKRLWLLAPALIVAVPLIADKNTAPRFAPGQASSYPSKQTNENVTIAVRTYETEELARTAFGTVNPYQYDILPVLVIVQNDTNESLRLDRLKVSYESFDGTRIDATPASDVPYTVDSPKRPNNPVPSPIPIKRKHKNPLGGGEIETRAFAARMLPPREVAYGFFYFQAHHRPGDSVYVTGIKLASSGKDLFYFEIPLKGQ
jgi:hypothetical protein